MAFAGPAPSGAMIRSGGLRSGLHFEKGMRIGLFGGSFNPAHAGHAHVAQTARLALALDRVIWLVSPQNPLKSSTETAPLLARMADVKPFVGPNDIVSDFETRINTTYTLETIRALKARFKGVHFVWIMGGDSLAGFHLWRGWAQICKLLPICVVSRPGALMRSRFSSAARRFASARVPEKAARLMVTGKAPAWTYLKGPLHGHSSTLIRQQKKALEVKKGHDQGPKL